MGPGGPGRIRNPISDLEAVVIPPAACRNLRYTHERQDHVCTSGTAGLVGHDGNGRFLVSCPVPDVHPLQEETDRARPSSTQADLPSSM